LSLTTVVVPAKATFGEPKLCTQTLEERSRWIPAFAGMTSKEQARQKLGQQAQSKGRAGQSRAGQSKGRAGQSKGRAGQGKGRAEQGQGRAEQSKGRAGQSKQAKLK